ncbi:MAG: YceI family protein [Streptosporangiaceae bacterium]
MTQADGHAQATGVPAGDTPDSVLAGPSTWTLDPAHSSVSLRSKTMWGLVTVRGAFAELAGNAEILPGGAARGRLEIGAASLNTKNSKRDRHLASADFFDAAEHPSIVADLASATRTGDRVAVQGTLTVAGQTRPLSFTAALAEVTPAAFTLRAEGVVVDRADFGLTWNQMGMPTGPSTADVVARFTRS